MKEKASVQKKPAEDLENIYIAEHPMKEVSKLELQWALQFFKCIIVEGEKHNFTSRMDALGVERVPGMEFDGWRFKDCEDKIFHGTFQVGRPIKIKTNVFYLPIGVWAKYKGFVEPFKAKELAKAIKTSVYLQWNFYYY